MKNFLIAFTVFLVWSFFGLWLYSWLLPQGIASAAVVEQENTSETNFNDQIDDQNSKLIKAKDSLFVFNENLKPSTSSKSVLKIVGPDDEILFLFPEGVTVYKNSDQVYIPQVSLDFKYKLNTYLIEHPDQELHISSLYSATENIQSPNYGIQRGMKIKQLLVDIGIPSSKIVVKPVIKEIEFTKEGSFDNSISFAFKPLNLARIEELKKSIPETMNVYPDFSITGLLVNDQLEDLLAKVVQIVQEKPDITIEIIGHTDNIGNDSDNYLAGLTNARQVRWYLITKGKLEKDNVLASSKGELDPIETNKTQRGRAANRRIEVKFY